MAETTLTAKLTMLTLIYGDPNNQKSGWEMDAIDNLILTVLEHHGIPYEEMGPHETFLSMAPYLFLEEVL